MTIRSVLLVGSLLGLSAVSMAAETVHLFLKTSVQGTIRGSKGEVAIETLGVNSPRDAASGLATGKSKGKRKSIRWSPRLTSFPEPAWRRRLDGRALRKRFRCLEPGGPAEVARILGGKDIAGKDVLDIGSGMGGADVALVNNHGAASVVGIDVERQLVDAAARRAQTLGLENRISYQLVSPGPLPFAGTSFDVVFSKDAIIHVADKKSLYAEMFRVLRPGGRLLVSDWLRGIVLLSRTCSATVAAAKLVQITT